MKQRSMVLAMMLVSTAALAQPEIIKRQDRHPAYANEPLPEQRVTTETIHTFEQRWEPVWPLLAQQAHERAVQARREAQNEPAGSVAPLPAPRPEIKAARVADRAKDLCERHGLRKVITNGGRSWRCR
jgi:hypothetical protein